VNKKLLAVVFLIAFDSTFTLSMADQRPKVFVGGEDSIAAQGIKDFQRSCPMVTITSRHEAADYSVGVANDGSGAARKGRSAVVSSSSGDLIIAASARELSSAVKNACEAIQKDWAQKH
jgi:hypothetical protein